MKNEKINIGDIHTWWALACDKGLLSEQDLVKKGPHAFMELVYPDSFTALNGIQFIMAKLGSRKALLIFNKDSLGFSGHSYKTGSQKLWFCPADHQNATRLRELFPFTRPSSLKNEKFSFGMGDRLDIASPGHIRAVKEYNAAPVIAQQSVRELTLTGRNYTNAIDSATWAVFQEGYRKPWGADGDHLKTIEMVQEALELGCTMITADLSDYIHNEFAIADLEIIQKAYNNLDAAYRKRIETEYSGKEYLLDTNEDIRFTHKDLLQNALIYKDAVAYARVLCDAGLEKKTDFDFEISIDETETPTSPQAHIFIHSELKHAGVEFVSLAPRFVGEFQKGIDYIGNIGEFKKSIRTHAAIARYFGGYKLSIHSGSDKFTVFDIIGEETRGLFHIKTSGTSWLEALRVIAEKAPDLFREIYELSIDVFPITSKNYHVTPEFDKLHGIDNRCDNELSSALDNPHDRRILHIAYGEIFKNKRMKDRINEVLLENTERYYDILNIHFKRHLNLLIGDKQ